MLKKDCCHSNQNFNQIQKSVGNGKRVYNFTSITPSPPPQTSVLLHRSEVHVHGVYRLGQTESAVLKVWMLYFRTIPFSNFYFINLKCHIFHIRKTNLNVYTDRVKRIWYLSPMRAAKVQASLRIRAVSPEPPLLAHRSSESRGTLR